MPGQADAGWRFLSARTLRPILRAQPGESCGGCGRRSGLAEALEPRRLSSTTALTPGAAFNGANGDIVKSIVADTAGNTFGVAASDNTANTGGVFEVPT